jgi:NTP pyrophosphatase (non-canonical NTP hydrolase)
LSKSTEEDFFANVLESHKVLCEIKQMDEKAAYGQNPALFYGTAVSAEAGEMCNKVIKALRNGDDPEAAKRAVISELPDVFIYGIVLAHVLDIDIRKLVTEKVGVVTQRARDGYYGGPLNLKKK